MKKLKRLAGKFFQAVTRSAFVSKFVARNFKLDDVTADIIIKNNPAVFTKALYQYPSAVNNGFRHIERVIDFVHYFKLPLSHAIVDVGAAEGTISGIFSEAFPHSQVYAFEPIGTTYNKLKENTASNPKITAINKALGSSNEQKIIHVAERITASSLFEMQKDIANNYFAEHLEHKKDEMIVITRADDELTAVSEINIMKLDVQGFELEVLRGAGLTLKKTNIVVLEMQNHELYTLAPKYNELDNHLRENNFELFDIIPSIRQDNKLYEWDGIYVNKKLLG